jgi:hypothetical protein
VTNPIKFIAPRIAFTDPNTGELTRAGVMFLQQVFDRVGGATGASTTDLAESLFEDAGSGETNATMFAIEQTLSQLPVVQPLTTLDQLQSELNVLRELVIELTKDVDGLKQANPL